MLRLIVGSIVTALVLSVLGCGQQTAPESKASETLEFAVEEMTCDGCVNSVTTAIKSVPGVQSVEVSLEAKKATVVADRSQVSPQAIEDAVRKAGYKADLRAAKE